MLGRLIGITVIFWIAVQSAFAQPAQSEIHHYGVNEGLPQTTVREVLQDRFGQIWVATGGGLASFDGRRFYRYAIDPIGNEGLKEEYIADMEFMPDGRLAVLTPHAIHVVGHDQKLERILEVDESQSLSLISGVDSQHVVIFSSRGYETINISQRKIIRTKEVPNGLCSNAHAVTGRGTWCHLGDSLILYVDAMKRTAVSLDRSITIQGILMQKDHWYRYGSGGVFRLGLNQGKGALPPMFANPHVSALCPLKNQQWAVGIRGSGLAICDSAFRVTKMYDAAYFLDQGLEWDLANTSHLFQDREGNLWAGTNDEGLFCISANKKKFEWLRGKEGELSGPFVRSVVKSGDRIWVGTFQDGLTCFDLRTKQAKYFLPGLNVNSLLLHGGRVWAGTDKGVFVGESNTGFEKIPVDGTNPEVFRILLDAKNRLWLNGSSGVFRLNNNGKWETITDLYFKSILFVGQNLYGRGGAPGIVPIMEGKRPDVKHPLLGKFNVMAIVKTRSATWAATRQGLLRIDEKFNVLEHLSVRDGLPDNCVYALLEDGLGRLWMGTNRGLSMFDPERRSFINFDPADGLQSYEFNTNAAFLDSDGTMFFGGVKGLNYFRPQELALNPHPPKVVLRSVKAGAQTFAFVAAGLVPPPFQLPYGRHDLDAEISALGYSDPESNQLEYKLEGLESTFRPHAGGSAIRYPSLGPGKYTLFVRAANNDGIWGKAVSLLTFEILPPFWSQWWFFLVVGGACTMLVGLFVWAWTRRKYLQMLRSIELQREIEKVRHRISRDMHDDLGAGLTKLVIMTERMRLTTDPRARELAGEIGKEARSLNSEMRHILSSVSPNYDTLAEFLVYLRTYAGGFLEETGMEYHFDFPEKPGNSFIHPDIRHAAVCVVKEALNNIAKHACAKNVWMQISVFPSKIQCRIRDDGKGFALGNRSGGHGLQNMKQRIEQQGGQIDIQSSGAGTEIAFELPLDIPQNGDGDDGKRSGNWPT